MKKIILILFVLLPVAIFAQEPFYYRIDKAKGLPSNTVYDIFQDSRGFMWIAGGQGLSKYDGRRFTTYSSDSQTLKSGSNIQEDKYGRIWYANFDGYIYYVENDSLKAFRQSAVWGYVRFGIVGNSLFCVEPGYITQYNIKSLKAIKRFSFPTSEILATQFDDKNFYVLSAALYRFRESDKFDIVPLPDFFKQFFTVTLMGKCKDAIIFAAKNQAVYSIFRNNKFESPQLLPVKSFLQNISSGASECWLCSTNGIIRPVMSNVDKTYKHYFKHLNITAVFRDKDGATWLGTVGDGIMYLPDFSTSFYAGASEVNVLNTLGDEILYGTKDEIFKTKQSAPTPTKLFSGKGGHETYLLNSDEKNERIFMTSNKFKILDKQGKLLDEMELAVKDLCRISDKYYAFAASGIFGFISINKTKDTFDQDMVKLAHKSYKSIDIYSVKNDVRAKSVAFSAETSTVYFATNKGLYYWKNNALKELKDAAGEPVFLNQLVCWKDNIWGLSSAGKIYIIDTRNRVIKMNLSGQLADGQIRRLKVQNNEMFVFAGNGLFRLEDAQMKLQKIIALNSELNLNDALLRNNQFILATSKGIIILSKSYRSATAAPGLVIKSMSVDGKPNHYAEKKNVFRSSQNNLTIDYSIITFDPNDTPVLFYSVNDAEWEKITDDRHLLELHNLAPGKYNLRLKSSNGIAFSEIKEINFRILQPFWFQWWFLSLALLFAALAIYKFDHWRTARINKKSQEIIDRIELEKAANQSKLKALKSQMNPHFFFNALNTIQSFILENDKKQAINYLGKFSGLTRSILEMSEKDEVSIAEEIKVLKLYLDIEKARFNDDFEYEISSSNLDEEVLKIPSLLLQPYVENAVKHGLLHKQGHKKLRLHFVQVKDVLRIILDDNGIGRKMSMELNAIKHKRHRSFATKATEQRVNLLNEYSGKKITLEYIDETNEMGQVTGTTVIFKIPLNEHNNDI